MASQKSETAEVTSVSRSEGSAPTVKVSHKGADRIRDGHLWVFASDVLDRGNASAGDVVKVLDPKGKVLGTAHYSSSSQITLRVLSSGLVRFDATFLRGRMEAALEYRRRVVTDSEAYRLVHAEGDLLPGLIVDRYGDYLVLQLLDQGMDASRAILLQTLDDLLAPKGIIARNDVPVRAKEELPLETQILAGSIPDAVNVKLNGLTLTADLQSGQKTGIFLDQRENYLAARRYARGTALDCFTATGGFALHLATACDRVEAIDSSAPTLESARTNAGNNGIANIEFRQADVLEFLPGLVSARRQYDVVVVDPPAFAKSRTALEGASRGYKELNLRALRLLSRGGILVTCSCSHHMSEANLLELVAAAALDSGKRLRVLERRTQSQDHPILLTVPETHYLKCLIFEVL
jgi:23S rRNA (cytosine1962-C5)-methyltransferase